MEFMIARVRILLDLPFDAEVVEPVFRDNPLHKDPDRPGQIMTNSEEVEESRVKAAKAAEKLVPKKLKELLGDQVVNVVIEEVRD